MIARYCLQFSNFRLCSWLARECNRLIIYFIIYMKKVKLLFLTLALLLSGSVGMRADEVQGYTWDFETPITTSAHDFIVAPNWKHIVHKYTDAYAWDFWMSYSYKETDGVDGSGALYAAEQLAGDWESSEVTYDLLVTPVVSGNVKIKVKAEKSSSFVEFYSLNETATGRNELLKRFSVSSSDYSTDGYTEVTYNVTEPQRIGIRASYAYLDDFSADVADIEPFKSITILSAVPSETTGAIYWDQNSEGNVVIKFTDVTVKNNGDVNLTQGDKNFSVSIINNKNKQVLGRVKVPQDLAVGNTSAPFEVTATIAKADISGIWSYSGASAQIYLQEDLQGSVLSRALSYYNAYESKYIFRDKDSKSSSSISSAVDFGRSSVAVSKEYEICNNGPAPLQVTAVTVPEGFSVSCPAVPFTVTKAAVVPVSVTMTAEPAGARGGDLVISYTNEKGDQVYKLPVKGNILSANTWYAEFNNENASSSNVSYPVGTIAEAGIRDGYKYNNGIYDVYLYSYTNNDYAEANNKFITPLLHANAGDKMTFDVARDASGSKYNLKVYVSADRVNWGEPVATIGYDDLSGSDYVTREISFPAEGNYYVGFAVYGMKLDNVIGLTKVDVAHDIYFSSVTQNAETQSGVEFKPTVKIYAPLGATASDYQVKYYVGDQVAAVDSKDIDAGAKKETTFNVVCTPVSEKTAVYPTHVEFAFTDGTVFSSSVQDLKVTNDPVFVFFDKGTSVSSSRDPESRKTAINFGTTNQLNLVQEFEIYNWGTAPLTVKSVSVPEGYTASIADVVVPAKTRQALDITFAATEAGVYNGKLEITYVDAEGADATFSLDVNGTLLDPAKWYASFDAVEGSAVEWPAGSLRQSNISCSKDKESNAIYSSSSSSNMFITPLLHAEAGETMSFDVRTYASNWPEGVVEVFAAKSREALLDDSETTTRVSLGKWSGQNVDADHTITPDYKNVSFAVPEAGDWYLGFTIKSRPYVDNIYGLKLVDVAHEVAVVSSSIPAEAMQNKESLAVVSLANFGLRPEADASYTVATYVNGVKSADVDGVELALAQKWPLQGSAVEVPFRSPKAGTFPVYVEVAFPDGYKVATAPVDVTFAEEVLSGAITIGKPNGFASVPNNLNDRNSEAISLYTPSELGFAGGEKIKSIVLKGYYSRQNVTTDVKFAYQWVDSKTLEKPSSNSGYDISAMTQYLVGEYSWPSGGSASAPIEMIKLTFDEPLVYEAGKSLMLLFSSSDPSFNGTSYFENSSAGQTFYHSNDGTAGTFTGSWSAKNSPVLHIELDVQPVSYATAVKDAQGNAVADAVVTLVSNDGDNVQYEGTTDADGNVTIPVIQSGRTYDVIVKTEGKEAYVDGVSFADGSVSGTEISLLPVVNVTDAAAHSAEAGNSVVYVSTVFTPGFNTVAFPFALSADEIAEYFGEDATVLEFVGEEGNGIAANAKFKKVDEMQAGVPYLVYMLRTTAPVMYKSKAVVAKEDFKSVSGTSSRLSFVAAPEVKTMSDGMFVLSGDNWASKPAARAANSSVVLPYRAYIQSSDPSVTSVSFSSDDDIYTSIDEIGVDDVKGDEVIYNLQGIRVYNPVKGNVYIVNGKKMLLK